VRASRALAPAAPPPIASSEGAMGWALVGRVAPGCAPSPGASSLQVVTRQLPVSQGRLGRRTPKLGLGALRTHHLQGHSKPRALRLSFAAGTGCWPGKGKLKIIIRARSGRRPSGSPCVFEVCGSGRRRAFRSVLEARRPHPAIAGRHRAHGGRRVLKGTGGPRRRSVLPGAGIELLGSSGSFWCTPHDAAGVRRKKKP